MSTDAGSEKSSNIRYGQWVDFFTKHPILIAKQKTQEINRQKKQARMDISREIAQELNIMTTEDQVARSFSNKNSRLLEKTDKSTGNVDPDLNADEKKFLDFLLGNLNPEITPDPLVQRLDFGVVAGATSYIPPPKSYMDDLLELDRSVDGDDISVVSASEMSTTSNIAKRPAPPPATSYASKRKQTEDNLRMQVLHAQLNYYQAKISEKDMRNNYIQFKIQYYQYKGDTVNSLQQKVESMESLLMKISSKLDN